MRVIAGKFRGRRLATPRGNTVRPTADRVKESVFSILREQVVNANFLDLCAGTGSIGIEALSRGAKHVTFVEREPRCIRIIERNLAACGVPRQHQQVRLCRGDVARAISHLRSQFDVIYFDAPYHAGLYRNCLTSLAEANLLRAHGVLLIEHSKQARLPVTVGELTQHRQAHYGNTHVSFYRIRE